MTESPAAAPLPAVELNRLLPFAPETVFRAWTDPAVLIRWFGSKDEKTTDVQMDARPGGGYRFEMTPNSWISGTYRQVVPPERLVFTWCHIQRRDDGTERQTALSLVTVTFNETNGGTEITLLHEQLSSEAARSGVRNGWTDSLEALSDVLDVAARQDAMTPRTKGISK